MVRISNLTLSLDEAVTKEKELASLLKQISFTYRITRSDILSFRIFKKAVDARRDLIRFVYNVDIGLKNEKEFLRRNNKNVLLTPDISYQEVKTGDKPAKGRIVIVGFGPSGIFAAYVLARSGYRPLVLERGLDVDKRTAKWNEFLKTREFHEHGSILFGEGGAGTYSDGKLTTLVNDIRSRLVLETLVEAGADSEILYINKPHIGTDELTKVIRNIRKKIIDFGGEIRFDAKVTNLVIENGKVAGVIVNGLERIDSEAVLLGIGHSARDTFEMLYDNELKIEPKPFSIGVRIEHPQKLINKSQYGRFADHPALGPADYKLSYHSPSGRTAYTFCMCPGGYVVASISEPGSVCTNGMSLSKRDNQNANSALLVNVTPDDFPSNHPLAGVEFQKQYEAAAYRLAGKNYNVPLQLVKDFLEGKNSTSLGKVKPTYQPGYTFARMSQFLPKFAVDTLREAIRDFDKKIQGFAMDDAILTGPETRSSSPIRIVRDEGFQASVKGIYPMGEGAGYAGGIMSSAIDGIKTAEMILQRFAPQKVGEIK